MAEKKRGKKRKDEFAHPGEDLDDKPTKEEFTVAKWIRKNVQIKRTKFANHNVEYFTGARAVDALLTSPFATREDPLFKTRENISDYLHVMLTHKFFHRARKVPVDEQELKGKKGKKKEKKEEKDKKSGESCDDEKKKEKDKVTDAESSVVEGSKEQKPDKEKRKKKIKLEMHFDQRFEDSLDAYVWIYDPIPFHYWIIGTLLVLGAIGVCLFPLWPPSVRLGVYYLSIAAAGFLVSIIVLAVIRLIIFCLIWILTMGKHHLWILPNLTEDVGFFASFWPLYTYEYKGNQSKSDKKSKKKKKDKDSDAEDDDKKDDNVVEEPLHSGVADVTEPDKNVENIGSESESESSQKSSTGKDFEIIDQEDVES
ncbi:translocation protein SEC62 [Diorhabda sublineata]|uniref:translocation protein SEC62 n=1 Tax=Diorhabda sublineata TaxID=1163346 RepID=UPI0024E18D0C|nr:translocation protein SEC62 [Diorhabda sublineata]